MSLKEVIRWQSARERAKLAEERRLRVRTCRRVLQRTQLLSCCFLAPSQLRPVALQ